MHIPQYLWIFLWHIGNHQVSQPIFPFLSFPLSAFLFSFSSFLPFHMHPFPWGKILLLDPLHLGFAWPGTKELQYVNRELSLSTVAVSWQYGHTGPDCAVVRQSHLLFKSEPQSYPAFLAYLNRFNGAYLHVHSINWNYMHILRKWIYFQCAAWKFFFIIIIIKAALHSNKNNLH